MNISKEISLGHLLQAGTMLAVFMGVMISRSNDMILVQQTLREHTITLAETVKQLKGVSDNQLRVMTVLQHEGILKSP